METKLIIFEDITEPGKLTKDDMPMIQAALEIFDDLPIDSSIYCHEICEKLGIENNRVNSQKIGEIKRIAFLKYDYRLIGCSKGFKKVSKEDNKAQINHLKSWAKRLNRAISMFNRIYCILYGLKKGPLEIIDIDNVIENIPKRDEGMF